MRLIFLTHHVDDLGCVLHECFTELMLSVEPLYSRRLSAYQGLRREIPSRRVAYDSGGFTFLIGRAKGPLTPIGPVASTGP